MGKKLSGRGCRNKGLGFERDIANKLRCIFPKAKRHLESQFVEAKGYDLDNTDAYGFDFRIQCKRKAKYSNPNKIEEVKIEGNEIPVLITKADFKKEIVCFYLDDLLKILNAARLKTGATPGVGEK